VLVELADGAMNSRTTRLPVSARNRFPELSTIMPRGADTVAELAALPSPVYVALPLPANVEMVPFGYTRRMKLPSRSEMYTPPLMAS